MAKIEAFLSFWRIIALSALITPWQGREVSLYQKTNSTNGIDLLLASISGICWPKI